MQARVGRYPVLPQSPCNLILKYHQCRPLLPKGSCSLECSFACIWHLSMKCSKTISRNRVISPLTAILPLFSLLQLPAVSGRAIGANGPSNRPLSPLSANKHRATCTTQPCLARTTKSFLSIQPCPKSSVACTGPIVLILDLAIRRPVCL